MSAQSSRRHRLALLYSVVAFVTTLLVVSPSVAAASAVAATPQWTVTVVSAPTNFAPGSKGGSDAYIITITNTGSAASDGSPITVFDELPEGVIVDPKGAAGHDARLQFENAPGAEMACSLASCSFSGTLVPDDSLNVTIPIDVLGNAPEHIRNIVRVMGGGAPAASAQTATTISSSPAPFGFADGGTAVALSSLQAGDHPDLTTLIAFNTHENGALPEDPKDTVDEMPPGFAGDLIDTPVCLPREFLAGGCPASTQIGVTTLTLAETGIISGSYVEPLYNLAPQPGDVARLGFSFAKQFFFEGDVTLRPSDYGLQTVFHNASEGDVELDRIALTVWGVPGNPIHDPLRFEPPGLTEAEGNFGAATSSPRLPFFTSPTTCSASQPAAKVSVDTWQAVHRVVTAALPIQPFVGCDRLGIDPALTVEQTTSRAASASGLDFLAHIPQTYENADALATSTIKRIVVKLPDGVTINPSSANGLGACTEAQYAAEAVETPDEQGCPSSSKIGTVVIHSPSLKEEATGSVFVAQPYENPFGTLLALYVVARIPDRGVIVKSAGEVMLDLATGQLTSSFDDLPPLPFDTLKLNLKQGPTAPLATPPSCGSFPSESQFTPWSEPLGEPLRPPIPPMSITSGPDATACPSGQLPFAPSVTAGTTGNQAGAFTDIDLDVARTDVQQEITRISAQLPRGLTADLVGVPFCSDAAIETAKSRTGAEELARPSCPAASEVGQTLTGAGVGGVLTWVPGKLYFAGPYHGAPFSVVAITPAKVGPYDLGTVVVREALQIDPSTVQVSVLAGASDAIPHILKGVVVHVRDLRIHVNRPSYAINPTNCEAQEIAATVVGAGSNFTSNADDDPQTVTNPFHLTGCASLAFKPSFKVSTSGRTSRKNGASLHVRLAYPKAPQGTQANIRYVKVALPRQLPSNLKTIQKACPDHVFEADPAGCPAASKIGTATAVTPLLPVPLSGPVYFVSHAAREFPDLVAVLQGYGVTIDLRGRTFIAKSGQTTTTFETIPDAPVGVFEMDLPQGPFSALAANTNLCKVKQLTMPTRMVAQNGATVNQNTKIAVGGCPRHKAKPRRKKK